MRFYKLLLVAPMIAFGFAMDANAGSCTLYHVPSGQGRGNGRLLYLSSGAYEKVTKDGCTNMFGTSDCVGDAMVCGDDTLGVATSVGGSGCNAGTKVIVDGGDSQKMGDYTVTAGLSVYSCDGRGGSKADWTRSTGLDSFGNCADASNFKKGDRYEEFFTKGDQVYYCIYSRYKTSNNNHACVASYGGAFCYMTKNQSSCYAKKLDYDKQNDTCKCKNKDEIYRDGKCIDDPVKKEKDCLDKHGIYQQNGNCRCHDNWVWNDKGQCVPSSQCNGPCVIEINLDNIGNISNSGNSSNTNENHNNSHNTGVIPGTDVVVTDGVCTVKNQFMEVPCSEYKSKFPNADLKGVMTCAKQCYQEKDGSLNWAYLPLTCNTDAGYRCSEQFSDGLGCKKCTKGRSGGGSGGGSGSGCLNRPTAEGRACCRAGKDTTYEKNVCACVDTTKEWKYTAGAEYGECVVKGSTVPVDPCNAVCTNYVSIVVDNCAMQKVNNYASVVTNITQQCANRATCDANAVSQLVNQIEVAVATCSQQPAEPAKPVIDEKRLAAAVEAIDKYRSGLDVSVWKDEEGNFNTARLVSDSIAGVVLGTAGGLITSSVVKKNQVKSGFEDIMCTIGGQPVGSYGDEIQVGIQ